MSHLYRRCSKCGENQASNPGLRMHKFPALAKNNGNVHQLMSWAMFCFPTEDCFDLDALKRLQLSSKVVCSKHFADSEYRSSEKIYLNKLAMPSIDEDKENILLNRAGPSHVPVPTRSVLRDHGQILLPTTSQVIVEEASTSTLVEEKTLREYSQTKPTQTLNRKLYNKCKYLMKTVVKLRSSIKEKNKDILSMLHSEENILKLLRAKISPSMALLLQGDLQNGKRRLKARRWTQEQKFLALELYKKSPTTYKLFRRLFTLPSISTLRNILAKIILKPGINQTIFKSLKKLSEKHSSLNDNLCILTFDEMSIRKNIYYNRKTDEIDGFQDHGYQGRSKEVASHALVFMLVWIRRRYKQPVAYYLSGDYVTADRLTVLIKEVLHECLLSGAIVVATVCDMAGVNVKALENLGSTVDRPYFKFDDQEIVALPDPPHLLKCFRNLFIKYEVQLQMPIKCTTTGNPTTGIGVASWKHIEKFFELDENNPFFVCAPKLTKRHIQPNGKEKMRVFLAAQIFSHSVATGILVKVSNNSLPAGAVATAHFLESFNNIFDLINADSPDQKQGNPYSTNLRKGSPHLSYFKKIKELLMNMEFLGCRARPPSHGGWLRLINGYERLWENLNKRYKVHTLATRRINQDPLENCFGCIRANCGSNNNPTVVQFIAGLKTGIITNMRNTTKINGNCQDDNNNLVENLKYLFSENRTESNVAANIMISNSNNSGYVDDGEELVLYDVSDEEIECSAETQACAYVCGFIFKKFIKQKNCENCKRALLVEKHSEIHRFVEFKEYVVDKQSLQYASLNFIACVEKCAELVTNYLKEHAHEKNVIKTCAEIIECSIDFKFLSVCPEHLNANIFTIIKSAALILVKRFCILENRKFGDQAAKSSLVRKIKILKNS